MEEEFDDRGEMEATNEVEELAKQFIEQVKNGLPVYFDSDDFQDVIVYFLNPRNFGEEYARQALDMALERYPTDPYIHILNATYFQNTGDCDRAEEELDFVEFNLQPVAELYVERLYLSYVKNEDVDTKALVHKALDMDPECVDAHLAFVDILVMEGNLDEAVQHALIACKLGGPEVLTDVCEGFPPVYSPVEHDRAYEPFIEMLTDKKPMESLLWRTLGWLSYNNGHYEKSVNAFKNYLALEGDIDDSFAYETLADALFQMQQYDSAISYFRKAKDIVQDYGGDLLGVSLPYPNYDARIGDCYVALQNYEAAICSYMEGQGHSENTLNVAQTLAKLGRYDEMRAFLRIKCQQNPDSCECNILLLNLLSPRADEQEMRDLSDHFLDSGTMDLETRQTFLSALVRHCYESLAPDLGLEYCERCVGQDYDEAVLQYDFALLYARKLMFGKACEHLERALQLDCTLCNSTFLNVEPNLAFIPEIQDLLLAYN